MTNYTKYSPAVIFAAPAQKLDYINRKESVVSGALKPGTVVQEVDGKFVPSKGDENLSYVLDRDHLAGRWADGDFVDGDRATAFEPHSGTVLNVRAAGNLDITENQPLYITDGQVTTDSGASSGGDGQAATSAKQVFGYAAQDATTTDADALVPVRFV